MREKLKLKQSTLLLTLILLVTCNRADKEKIILNKNFRGHVLIIHNQPDGLNEEHNGRKVLTIPENGILKVRSSVNVGWQDQEVYIKNSDGKMTQIPIYSVTGLSTRVKKGEVDTSNLALFGGTVGTSTFLKDGVACELDWRYYIFGTYSETLDSIDYRIPKLKHFLDQNGVKVSCLNNN